MNQPKIVNLSALPWRTRSRSDHVTVDVKDPARHLGSTVCGFVIERVAPGKQASPPHRHHLQEEMFLILAGTGVLRHGGREFPVRAGDFIVYPPGDPAAHTFVNDGPVPLEYIATGNRVSYEVCEYPEDGTVYVEALDKTLRNEAVPSVHATIEAR
ncbi:MAG: cupin domain-containing protein [Burkholderiaceae bacterium]|nr:cupin domain-containing protein [Burkholderiaceae bacterium]